MSVRTSCYITQDEEALALSPPQSVHNGSQDFATILLVFPP